MTKVGYPDDTGIGFSYDKKDNMVQRKYYDGGTVNATQNSTYDSENQLINKNGQTYDYDNNGNMKEGDTVYRYLSTFLDGEKVN